MMRLPWRRQALWMVCASVLLLPQLAAAQASLATDLDGDGRHDQVKLDRREPSVLHVGLSASRTTQVIRSRVALLQVVAADLDGDRRPELIARGTDSQLHVWRRRRVAFHSYRPRELAPVALERYRGSVEDKDREPTGVITCTPWAPVAVTPCRSPRAPRLEASTGRAAHTVRAFRSSTAVEPFAPRPPPAHTPR